MSTTIQISDTGIEPGAGMGNRRKAINKDTLGCKVIAIGVPTVVDAATIVQDIMSSLIEIFSIVDAYRELTDMEQYQFIKEIASPEIRSLYVTPKDIDEDICKIGIILAEALNSIWKKSE